MSLAIVVLLSGQGSNLQALIDAKKHGLNINICAVISDQIDAPGLIRAQQANIPTHAIPRAKTEPKANHEAKILAAVTPYQPNYIVLAGYMRILSENFIRQFPQKILNIHPSLLPTYPGLDTFNRVLTAKEPLTGTTVHLVTETVDAGPIIAATTTVILPNDTETNLKERIQTCEHQLYPLVLSWLADDRLIYKSGRFLLDNALLPAEGIRFSEQIPTDINTHLINMLQSKDCA